ncbi:MAG: S9 family peptidase [Gammaproteobacteria bacterium]|nr:S9 family peptidase [Gammaproteobacteria bacterium]
MNVKALRADVLKFHLLISILLLNSLSSAQDLDQSYRTPPLDIADIADAQPTPSVSIDPAKNWMLLLGRPGLPSIAELSQPELRIAGMRINPANNGRSRSIYFNSLTLQGLKDGSSRAVTGLPINPRIRNVSWSPNSSYFAFTLDQNNHIELWLADVATASAKRLIQSNINAIFGSPYSWMSDSLRLLVKAIPDSRGPAPLQPVIPLGPVIQESTGRPAAARTYQDLMVDSHDEDLFEHYGQVQLLMADVSGYIQELGAPDLIRRAIPAPGADFLLVETVQRPFSYLVPQYRFPHRLEVWDSSGNLLREVASLPLAEEVPVGRDAVPTGPRSMDWRDDAPATLFWVEAQDGGDPRADAVIRDALLTSSAPFRDVPETLIELEMRYAGTAWGDGELALVNESWWSTRQTRSWVVSPDGNARPELLFDRSTEDRYKDPGSPVTSYNQFGKRTLLISGSREIYLSGAGASAEGDRPFLDRLSLNSKDRKRLWRSEGPIYAAFIGFLDNYQQALLIRQESPTEPGNYFRVQLNSDQVTALTSFQHPYPHMLDVYKEVVRYERDDGVMLSATLYLPPGKTKEDGPFPMLMWAYPREFKNASSAGQMRGSPHRFNAISVNGPLPFLASGYAVFDGPTMPIIGEGETEPNDVYVEQLVSSAAAAVETVVNMGVAEPNKIAIGGHSYGAFMTANLLAHSDLFVTGLARSGAYNRTLTPFGFQAEERTFWEAPDIYFRMSPFMHASQVEEPILMIHGEADNNSGTFPLQSRRFYNALKGHGVKTRLVMLPHESHGYRARESVMHTLWEMNSWLNRYVADE